MSHPLIIIPSEQKRDEVCDFVTQTCQELVSQGYSVVVVKVEENKFLLFNIKKLFQFLTIAKRDKKNSSLKLPTLSLLPGNRFASIRKINTLIFISLLSLLLYFQKHELLLWIFFPATTSWVRVMKKILGEKITVLFDIVDFFSSADEKEKQRIRNQQKYLLKNSDTITCIGKAMKSAYQKLDHSAKITVVPQGFKVELFAKKYQLTKKETLIIDKIKKINKPLIGYLGAITHRFDIKLVTQLVQNNPHWKFVFVGPVYIDTNVATPNDNFSWWEELNKKQNVYWVPAQPKKMIAALLALMDVLILPYDTKCEFNLYCHPMKIFEYLYTEKPILSTSILELTKQPFKHYLTLENSKKKWQLSLQKIIGNKNTASVINRRKNICLENSWGRKIDHILDLIKI